jgi:hypothetical protein
MRGKVDSMPSLTNVITSAFVAAPGIGVAVALVISRRLTRVSLVEPDFVPVRDDEAAAERAASSPRP